MDVTIAICTWNRSALLDQTLERMHALKVPAGVSWEIVIVNNNSTDDTEAIIDRHVDKLPIRRFVETKQGHSNARNCALDHTHGELLIWTDDDVLVDPDWMTAYWDAARKYPEAQFFGGPSRPWFVKSPSRELETFLQRDGAPFALVDHSPEERPLTATEYFVGANMAFRTSILRPIRFNPKLGRVGKGMVGDDEVQVIDRIRAAGGVGIWLPRAIVLHYIPPERMTNEYLWSYYAGLGRTEARRYGVKANRTLAGRPLWAVSEYWKQRLRSNLRWCTGRAGWLHPYTRAAFASGILAECREANANSRQDADYFLPPQKLDEATGTIAPAVAAN